MIPALADTWGNKILTCVTYDLTFVTAGNAWCPCCLHLGYGTLEIGIFL
jgi:hypothetical protein